ncbi:Uma2 family endonuclease [Methylococcus sp. ANG]|uniref:Uma2 family endonuclease n=1 Tax=Methylococcus sp. ANG TaxID=3231903 RepID=UPI00345B1011
MSRPAERLAEYRDLFDLPEHVIGEILNGQLVTQPRPAPRHAQATSILTGEIVPPYHQGRGGPGGWWILFEPEMHLGPHILVPDLAGWRRERMPALPDEAYFTLAPDWVCEVLSPGTARIDRVVKMPIYAGQAVQWLWLVEPDLHTLEVFRLHDGHWLLEGAWQEADEVRAPPFAELAFSLADLWASTAGQQGEGEQGTG